MSVMSAQRIERSLWAILEQRLPSWLLLCGPADWGAEEGSREWVASGLEEHSGGWHSLFLLNTWGSEAAEVASPWWAPEEITLLLQIKELLDLMVCC